MTVDLVPRIKAYFQAAADIRRGVCLLNAGQLDAAEAAFARAQRTGAACRSLPAFLAACRIADDDPSGAAEQLTMVPDDGQHLRQRVDATSAPRIRQALALWAAGKSIEALDLLREGLRQNAEDAELHFQLGTLLASQSSYEEAELRFTQAVSIDPDHTEALVSLAMCFAVRGVPEQALACLRRAQARRPYDARIGLLLTQAAKAVQQRGRSPRARSEMPPDDTTATAAELDELVCIVENEPDFVEAFLAVPEGGVDPRVFAVLLCALEAALQRQPQEAGLLHRCGRVLDRLNRLGDAITRNEQAVEVDPHCTQALIELGRLYARTDRHGDAARRLEQAVAAGADYPDVHTMLGDLYRRQNQIVRAKSAYHQALKVNCNYQAAQEALGAITAAE